MSRSTAGRPEARSRGHRAFLRQFVLNTNMIGAIAPSSPHLAREIVAGLDFAGARTVLEFGPGSGVVTDAILPNLRPETKFVAIELNDEMARQFRRRHPRVTLVHDTVERVRQICDDQGIDQADLIISGLPWASFPEALQVRILDAMAKVLRPGGVFVTFGYQMGRFLPAGRRFTRLLPKYFKRVERSRVIWRNIPPAFVMRASR